MANMKKTTEDNLPVAHKSEAGDIEFYTLSNHDTFGGDLTIGEYEGILSYLAICSHEGDKWAIINERLPDYRELVSSFFYVVMKKYGLYHLNGLGVREYVSTAAEWLVYEDLNISTPRGTEDSLDEVAASNVLYAGAYYNRLVSGILVDEDIWTDCRFSSICNEHIQLAKKSLATEGHRKDELPFRLKMSIDKVLEQSSLINSDGQFIGEKYQLRALVSALIKEEGLSAVVSKYKKCTDYFHDKYGVSVSDRALRKLPQSDGMKDAEKIDEAHFRAIIKRKASS